MKSAPPVHTARWQGVDISNDPGARSYELRNVVFEVDLAGNEDLDHYRQDTGANLPWADDHFLERIGGEPLNPGVQWANWPWAASADRHRHGEAKQFNHTYMERLWPKWAHLRRGGVLPISQDGNPRRYPASDREVMSETFGIAWSFGDLEDLVKLLAGEPDTRQAWIPLFFPEDTGIADGGRKPCTLGYQFLVRRGKLHTYYPLRSCDLVRHFRDDIYLAVRLMLWVLDQCRRLNPDTWNDIVPGGYMMHCTSLHVFENDMQRLKRGEDL
jgi:thymidylate synthase